MTFEALLAAAQQLSDSERRQLADALWQTLPDDAEWDQELERRMHAADQGGTKGTPWSQVRDEALASLRNDQAR